MARGTEIGTEVNDKELLDFPIEFLGVVITNKAMIGKSLAELAAMHFARGVFLKKLTRTGQTMPLVPELQVERGDLMTLIGAEPDVEQAAKSLGYADRQTITTDMIFVGLGIFLGGLVGLLTIVVAGLGACCGARTITAALRAIQEEAKSELPALGYAVPYAVGNILLTAWGPILVAMMS
jgi:putative transport protein